MATMRPKRRSATSRSYRRRSRPSSRARNVGHAGVPPMPHSRSKAHSQPAIRPAQAMCAARDSNPERGLRARLLSLATSQHQSVLLFAAQYRATPHENVTSCRALSPSPRTIDHPWITHPGGAAANGLSKPDAADLPRRGASPKRETGTRSPSETRTRSPISSEVPFSGCVVQQPGPLRHPGRQARPPAVSRRVSRSGRSDGRRARWRSRGCIPAASPSWPRGMRRVRRGHRRRSRSRQS